MLARLREAFDAASDATHTALEAASSAALSAGSKTRGAAADAVAALKAEDPEDIRGTVICSPLNGWLRIKPGKGKLDIVSAWFGHPSDPDRRKDLTKVAQARVTFYNSLDLPVSCMNWGDPAPQCFKVMSVTYHRHSVPGHLTLGEQKRAEIARTAVAQMLERVRYEALKQVAGSPAMGSWICAVPLMMGVQVPGKSVHAIFVSTAEVIHWTAEGVRIQGYLAFLREVGASEMQLIRRPPDAQSSESIVRCARSFVDTSCDPAMLCKFKDSRSFVAHCFDDGGSTDTLGYVKAAGTMGAAVLVAAHIDEAAAAVALPLFGVAPAAAVGVIGAVVVSPLLLAGLWHVQRRNDERMGFAVFNLTSMKVAINAFELTDRRCHDWGLLRSSCAGLGGSTSSELGTRQLGELNPPSSSDVFQLRCQSAQGAVADSGDTDDADGAECGGAESGGADEVDNAIPCVQTVTRGRVYWVCQIDSALIIKEVPLQLIPAYSDPKGGSLSVPGERCN